MPLKVIKNAHDVYSIGVDENDADLLTEVVRVNYHRQTEGVYISYPVLAPNKGYNKNRYDRELHLFVVERALNRKLKTIEVVHHIDGSSCSAYRSNLLVCKRSEHSYLHRFMSKMYAQKYFSSLESNGITWILKNKNESGEIKLSLVDVDLLAKRLRLRRNGSHVIGDFRLEVAVQKRVGGQGNQNYQTLSSIVCARMIGRELTHEEIPHHKNADPLNNQRKNLQICKRVEHGRLHARMSHFYVQENFQSPLTDEKLQLLEKLLSRKTQTISGVHVVV